MPRVLLLLKIIIAGIALYAVVSRDYNSVVQVTNGYCIPFSAFNEDTVNLHFNVTIENRKARFRLYDIMGTLCDSIKGEAIPVDTNANAYSEGFGYNLTAHYNTDRLKPGIYFWDHLVPMIVKDRKAQVVIIYPFISKHAESNLGGKSFYGYNSSDGKAATVLSLNRPLTVDTISKSFMKWILENIKSRPVSFATEMDIEQIKSGFPDAKLLVFFGDSPFWTEHQRKSFDDFIKKGGNVLMIGSSIMNNKVILNKQRNQIIFEPIAEYDGRKIYPLFNYPGSKEFNFYSTGTDHIMGGVLKEDAEFRVVNEKDELFKNMNYNVNDVIRVKGGLFSGSAIKRFENSFIIDNDSIRFHKTRIAAMVLLDPQKGLNGMIGIFQKYENSGYIINIGYSGWIDPLILKRQDATRITRNAIELLLKEKTLIQ